MHKIAKATRHRGWISLERQLAPMQKCEALLVIGLICAEHSLSFVKQVILGRWACLCAQSSLLTIRNAESLAVPPGKIQW